MSPRTTGLLLLAALGLGALVYLLELRSDEPGPAGARHGDVLFAGLAAPDVIAIELDTSDGQAVRAERDGSGWRLVRPGAWPADAVALDAIASQLVDLQVEGRAEAGARAEEFGFADDTPRIRFEAGGRTHALRLGGPTPVGSNSYVMKEVIKEGAATAGEEPASVADDRPRDDGGPAAIEIAWLSTWRTNALRKSLVDLRDRRVLDFDHAAVEALDVSWPGGAVRAEKLALAAAADPADDDAADDDSDDDSDGARAWRLVAPIEGMADRATIETLLSDLAFLRAEGFVDAPLSEEESGLGEPEVLVRLRIRREDGETSEQGLALGAVRDGLRIARGSGGALFLVAGDRLDEIPRELFAYRDKAVGRFDVADARTLSLAFPEPAPSGFEASLRDDAWVASTPGVGDERVRAMVAALARLDAFEIVAEEVGEAELAGLGLAPPRVRARVTGEGGAPLADVSLGLHERGRGVLARRGDSPIVYRVDEALAERLPLAHEEIAARFTGEVDPPDDESEPNGGLREPNGAGREPNGGLSEPNGGPPDPSGESSEPNGDTIDAPDVRDGESGSP